uniref:ACB domain-containing protein n=1 Tax=Steinernema glaseri TaxID=37863 RepID=A0A1I7YT03_9BILA
MAASVALALKIRRFFENLPNELWDFCRTYWFHIFFFLIVFAVGQLILVKILAPPFFFITKYTSNTRGTLRKMKQALEADYEDYHWNNPNFCKAYLALYSNYRELRAAAKRDFKGKVNPNNHAWDEFDQLTMGQLYSNYRELRAAAKRDFKGKINPNNHAWDEFDQLTMGQVKKPEAKEEEKTAASSAEGSGEKTTKEEPEGVGEKTTKNAPVGAEGEQTTKRSVVGAAEKSVTVEPEGAGEKTTKEEPEGAEGEKTAEASAQGSAGDGAKETTADDE